jgi:hypothetical protein
MQLLLALILIVGYVVMLLFSKVRTWRLTRAANELGLEKQEFKSSHVVESFPLCREITGSGIGNLFGGSYEGPELFFFDRKLSNQIFAGNYSMVVVRFSSFQFPRISAWPKELKISKSDGLIPISMEGLPFTTHEIRGKNLDEVQRFMATRVHSLSPELSSRARWRIEAGKAWIMFSIPGKVRPSQLRPLLSSAVSVAKTWHS